MTSLLPADYLAWKNTLQHTRSRGIVFIQNSALFIKQLKVFYNTDADNIFDTTELKANSSYLNKVLGNEFEFILFNAKEEFDANLFTACVGALIGGGIIFVVLADTHEAVYSSELSLFSEDREQTKAPSKLLERLLDLTKKFRLFAYCVNNEFQLPQDNNPPLGNTQKALDEQLLLIKQIERVANGHSRRPLVITANRGRGKSAALGIATANLLKQAPITIIVSAPHLSNLSTFYKHLKLTEISNNNLQLTNGSVLSYLPIDQIIQHKPQANLIIIDEAAAIPVFQLEKIIENYNRIVFSTTVHGYEGNGKGFEVRFKQKLLTKYKQSRFATLKAPIRWSEFDKLEKICFATFLLDVDLPKHHLQIQSLKNLMFRLLSVDELNDNEKLLRQVFSILINAHYQTRPADLEQILTNPKVLIVVLADSSLNVYAVALLNKEGSLSQEVIAGIENGTQRIAGELLPQSIVAHLGFSEMASFQFLRVMRVAVHPDYRRKGLGSRILKNIIKMAQQDQVEFVGASFSMEINVVKFWLSNGFSAIRIGSSIDSSSGQKTIEMLSSINPTASHHLTQINDNFAKQFYYQLNGELKKLSTDIVFQLLTHQLTPANINFNEIQKIQTYQFINSARSLSMVDWVLTELLQLHLSNIDFKPVLSHFDYYFLIDCLIRQSTIDELAKTYDMTGKKQVTQRIRSLFQVLYAQLERKLAH